MSATAAAGAFVPFAIAAATATAGAGFLSDRFGPRVPLFLSLALLLVALSLLNIADSTVLLLSYAATLGGASGTQGAVAGMAWTHYYGREDLGKVQGPTSMVMISGAALAPLPLAALYQLSGAYASGLVLLAAVTVVCAVLALLFDPKRTLQRART